MTLTKSSALSSLVRLPSLVRLRFAIVLCPALMASIPRLLAQSPSSQNPLDSPDINSEQPVHGSIDLGYRYNNLVGSGDMYDTLTDLHTGPRLFDETFSFQSPDHSGLLFDDLYLNSFGWGGDPDNALRLGVDKGKWYNLQGSFRRDHYFSDFDLLGNPLNPSTSLPSIPVTNSPNEFDTTRRMTDVDLTLLPHSRVTVRLGYSHNNMTGPTFGGVHEGTEALLLEPWNTTSNAYRMGFDARIAPRTFFSFDQFFDYYRGDTDAQLASFAPAALSNGNPVELGLSIDTKNSEPCALKTGTTSLLTASGVLTNPSCSGYFGYERNERVRTSSPTERAGFRSNYFQRLDVNASYSYGWADMTTPLYETFNGLITRTNTLAFVGTGAGDANRISNVGDFAATVRLTHHLRLIEKFYFWSYRMPENADYSETDSDCTTALIKAKNCTLLTPLTSTTPTITPTLAASSFNQTLKRNQDELAWDITTKIGARIGYRYGDRNFDQFVTFTGDENTFLIHENTGLFGVWARPLRGLRMNFDLERVYYDNVIVRIAPRKESRYRFQSSYTPRPWATVGASLNMVEQANADSLTNYIGHNRNYGFTATLNPRSRIGLDLAYNYNDVIQNALICFNDTPPTGVTLPFVSTATKCPEPPTPPATTAPNPLYNDSYYTNHTQFGMAAVRYKPQDRVSLLLGYGMTNVDGTTPQFNILQPLGTLQYKFYQPLGNVSVSLGHNLAWNSGWNYYQYDEGSFVGPTAPRYFHANSLTEAVRYAF